MTTEFKPFPFDPVHDAALLNAAGYEHTHYPASWEDIGGPENGPHLIGGPAYDEWNDSEGHYVIVERGMVVDAGRDTFWDMPDDWGPDPICAQVEATGELPG